MNAIRAAARGRLALAGAALLLAACSSLPHAPSAGAAGERFAGRFSLAVAAADPAGRHESWTGRFSLVVDAGSVSLDLVSPLGATLARIETDAHEARLLVPEGGGVRVERGNDAQSLLERVLGWSLPVEGMPAWVAGHPDGARPFTALAAPGAGTLGAEAAAQRFAQDGWSVTVEPPAQGRAGRLVQMERGAQDGSPAVTLRVVLDAAGST